MKRLKHSLSSPSSQASSTLSLNDLHLDDLITDPNTHTDLLNEKHEEMPTDTDEIPTFYKSFTSSHPLGNLLLRLTSMNIELCKKANVPTAEMPDLADTCKDFVKAIKMERNRTHNNINNISADIENSILNKELNYHSVNASIVPPTKFSPAPVIINAAKLNEVMKAFPCKSNQKFNGTSSGVNIVEFLNNMNTGQEIMNLSKNEFLQMLLRCVSGKVYNLLSETIHHEKDVSNIYHSLMCMFDTRLSSSSARKILSSYKASRNTNLTKVQSYILEIASRIASALPAGPSRTGMFNLEANSALVRCLPSNSSVLVNNIINNLTAKLQRHPSFIEVTKCISKYSDTINSDIEKFGIIPTRGNNQMYMNSKSKYKVYSINKFNKNNGNYNNNNKHANNNFNNRRGSNRNNKFDNKKYRDSPKNESVYNMNNASKGGKYCSLCGEKTHSAADLCFKMRDDQHRLIQVIPTYKHCEDCLNKLGKKLFHPSSACISRDVYLKNVAAKKGTKTMINHD